MHYEYKEEMTFQLTWEHMISYYNIQENFWLSSIYKVKEKWAKCYMKNTRTMGMQSTQLSESLNVT